MIIRTCFHGQNVEKRKKDKIVILYFPKFVSFYHLSSKEELRFSEIFLAISLTKVLIDKKKEFFIFLKNKNETKTTTKTGLLSRK